MVKLFWKTLVTIYILFVLNLILLIERIKPGCVRRLIRLVMVKEKALTTVSLFIFEPFLWLVNYLANHCGNERGKINRKVWSLLLINNLIATIVWLLFIFFKGLAIYKAIGIEF